MTRSLLPALVAMSFLSACGQGALPMGAPAEPERLPSFSAAKNPPQRFALTSSSADGWSLTQHAAVEPSSADFTLDANGCRGWVAFEISSRRFTFARVGGGFASVSDVPTSVPSETYAAPTFTAGGSSDARAIGDGYVVLLDGQPYGQLRVVDHTLVPESWDGKPVQVTLEFTSQRATP